MKTSQFKTLEKFKSVTKKVLKLLYENGYDDVASVSSADPGQMSQRLNIPLERVNRIIQEALLNTPTHFMTGTDFTRYFNKLPRLLTGIKHLDAALDGGLVAGSLIELVGPCNVGKTQLAHHLLLRSMLPPEQGGLGTSVVFIDTENTFRPKRLAQLAPAMGLNIQDVLNRVWYQRAIDAESQLATMTKLFCDPYALIPSSQPLPRVIVIDSVCACYRAEFSGRGELADRQQKMNKFLRLCYKYASTNEALVIYTNQVITTPTAYGAIYSPVGGNITGHANTYRFKLSRVGDTEARLLKVVDSPDVCTYTFRYFLRTDRIEADAEDPIWRILGSESQLSREELDLISLGESLESVKKSHKDDVTPDEDLDDREV